MNKPRTDGLSLGFGLVFLAAVAWWLARHQFAIPLPASGWLAAALILFGLIGLVYARNQR